MFDGVDVGWDCFVGNVFLSAGDKGGGFGGCCDGCGRTFLWIWSGIVFGKRDDFRGLLRGFLMLSLRGVVDGQYVKVTGVSL